MSLDNIANRYVKLLLKVGLHDEFIVDAYFGPEEWVPKDKTDLNSLLKETQDLIKDCSKTIPNGDDSIPQEIINRRKNYLYKQILSIKTKIHMLLGKDVSFNDELAGLYDILPLEEANFSEYTSTLDEIKILLGNTTNPIEELKKITDKLTIPTKDIGKFYELAIEECRKRTLPWASLDSGESFSVECVTNQPWSGYNWYKGNSKSVISVNTDLPFNICRLLHLASHEGYPGHHTFHSLLETELSRKYGWIEYQISNLFSPQVILAEGTANVALSMIFTEKEEIDFILELAKDIKTIDGSVIKTYFKISKLFKKIRLAEVHIAKNYLDGLLDKEQTIEEITRNSLCTRERACKRVDFIDRYRGYIANYSIGEEYVLNYLSSKGGDRINNFYELISQPFTPSDINAKR